MIPLTVKSSRMLWDNIQQVAIAGLGYHVFVVLFLVLRPCLSHGYRPAPKCLLSLSSGLSAFNDLAVLNSKGLILKLYRLDYLIYIFFVLKQIIHAKW